MTQTLHAMDLNVHYGAHRVLENLSFGPLKSGRVIALLGPNGSGKSTLLKTLAGLEYAGKNAHLMLNDKDLMNLSVAQRAKYCVYLPQTLPPRVHIQVLESVMAARKTAGFVNKNQSYEAEVDEVLNVFTKLHIEDLALRFLDQLSGGQRQLVGMAQGLVCQPHLFLLDEPLSALDLHRQYSVMQILEQETRARNIVTIVVLHDLNIALRQTDYVLMLEKGKVIAEGSPEEVITPARLAKTYKVDARVEKCSQGTPHIVVDGVVSSYA